MTTLSRQLALSYTHTQATPSDTWVVVHNLSMYPVVDVYVTFNTSPEKVIPQGVVYTDKNTCTITFTTAYAGTAVVS